MVSGTISEAPFHQEEGEPAFSIEVETTASAEEVVEAGPSFAELLAVADADRGARQWAKCRACHTVEKDGRNGTGPNLYGIVGRTVAALDDFNYSNALKEIQTSVWTYESLDEWLLSPRSFASGTSMSFAGLRKPEQRADLIAYLATFSDAPVPLPAVVATEQVEDTEE
jgi:cytochrome c